MGTTLVGVVAQITHVTNAGVAMISIMFIIGFLLFCKAVKLNQDPERRNSEGVQPR